MVQLNFAGEDLEKTRKHDAIGFCIYCNKSAEAVSNLTMEHIFAKGLGGKHVLPKSSCIDCAAITGAMEQKLLRGPLWPVRVRLGIHSGRRASEQPIDFDVEFWKEDDRRLLTLPIQDVPVNIMLPVLDPPAILTGLEWSKDGSFTSMDIISFNKKSILDSLYSAMSKNSSDKLGLGSVIDKIMWMRFIAKTLHGYAHATVKGGFTPYLNDIILGKDTSSAGYYVGSSEIDFFNFEELNDRRTLCAISYLNKDGKNLIIGILSMLRPQLRKNFMAVIGEF